ncbi:YggS family pyridoxal phosphate-dependent enzyme [Chloroflexota bacterium]
MSIRENTRKLLQTMPDGVFIVAAAKTRTGIEISEAIEAGITNIGHNYVQEAENTAQATSGRAKLHLIGHLQRNKVKRAARLFDMIETIDSAEIARVLNDECGIEGKTMPVLIEVNSGREPQKSGVLPEDAIALAREITQLNHISLSGLMTIGPLAGDAEMARPYFQTTWQLFRDIKKLRLHEAEMQYLSMGMSDTYVTAIEEGANLVRIGTAIFGPRPAKA